MNAEDQRLPHVLNELSRLRENIVGVSETRRPVSGETSSNGFTYYKSGISNVYHVNGVVIGVSSRLQPSDVEVILVDESIMRLKLIYNVGFMSVVAVYAPTEMCETKEKEMFYVKLDSVLDQCPCRDALIVLGDVNAVNGTERAGYELYVGPHCSGNRNDNNCFLLNLARSRWLRIAGSRYQRPALHRWTWYNNAGRVAKIGHILKLKDLKCAEEYAVTVSIQFGVLDTIEVELWDTFKRETLEAENECVWERPRTRALLRRDMKRYVRGLAEDIECHLNANDLRPVYRTLDKLRSKSTFHGSAIQTADDCFVSDTEGQMGRWAKYFQQLFTVDPPS
ncbi:uncharacterized protein LOC123515575 [Portunus trituberculatus]|uniref:uncharacterized protein LOC123515575 n=1 Tax=Portunus trituberculatus TaxID=210409 RepID=UPI001E1CC1B8|nr:uncharacterized protein LOC123515575 [Portunus trituberculatus]